MSYESPIKLIQSEIEDGIYNKIRIVVDVDKEELIKALRYDRNQYEKGYSDAKQDQLLCEDCKFFYENRSYYEMHKCNSSNEKGYCFWAERK